MNDDDPVARLELMKNFIDQLFNVVVIFAAQLLAAGCTCPWDLPVELTDEEFEAESRRVVVSRHYQLLIGVDDDFREATGYEFAGIGRHIHHDNDCPVSRVMYSRTN